MTWVLNSVWSAMAVTISESEVLPARSPRAVDAGMQAGGPGLNRRDGIGGRKPVVVVAVEVENRIGPGDGHHADEVAHVIGRENAQRVREQNPFHLKVLQCIDKALDVAKAVAKAVRPVLEVDVDAHVLLVRVAGGVDDAPDVFFGRHPQLLAAVAFRALGQKVDYTSACVPNPVHGSIHVAKPEHLHAVDQTRLPGPAGDAQRPLKFAGRSARGHDLDTVHPDILEQHAGHVELFRRRIGDSGRLLAVPERRIHDGNGFFAVAGHRLTHRSLSVHRAGPLAVLVPPPPRLRSPRPLRPVAAVG